MGVLSLAMAPAWSDQAAIAAANNQVAVHAISTLMDYTEIGNGAYGTSTGILDTEKGRLPGASLSITHMDGDTGLYLSTEAAYARGFTDYTGSPLGGGMPYGSLQGSSTASLIDLKGGVGIGLRAGDSVMFTPYAELAWHLWDRGVNRGETYTYYHAGAGLLGQYTPSESWVISAHLLLGRTFDPYIEVNGYFSGPLGDTAYSNAGVAADYALTRQVHALLSVETTRFRFGMSEYYRIGTGTVWEPDSESRYTLLKLGLGYTF